MSTTVEQMQGRLREVEDVGLRNNLNLRSHEKQCALRYEALWNEVRSTNRTLRWAGTTLIVGMAGILAKLVFFS